MLYLVKMSIEEQNEIIELNHYNSQAELQSTKSSIEDVDYELEEVKDDLENAKSSIEDIYWP